MRIEGSNETNAADCFEVTLTPGKLTITPKQVDNPTIVLEPSEYFYHAGDGTIYEPEVTVKDGDTVIPDTEYTITYSNNTGVGTATVTITDKDGGNYTVSGSATFLIKEVTYTGPVWNWTGLTAATATFTGSDGSTKSENAEITNEVTTEATCTAPGVRTYKATATFNGTTYTDTKTEAIAALGHDYNAVVTAPTCTEQGYTTHTCSRCNDSYVDTYVEALGHSWGEWTQTTAPTCTEAGVETRTCSRCDVTETRPVAALGHDFGEWTQTTAPTCTAAGEETRSCSRCDATETRPVPATGHNMTEHPAVAATCETAGNSAYWSCDQCNKYFSDAEGNTEIEADSWVIDALNHAWPAADAQEGIAWAWTGNDTDGYTAATLTLTCTRDNSHTHTETVTVTGAAGEGNDLGYTVYTATVSFDNKTYTDTTRTPITYTITYNLDNGALAEGATNPTSYTVESDEITLNNPTKEGYTFAGWTGTELNEATMEVTIVAGSTGNREYTATWNPVVTFNANFVPEGSTEAATAEQVWTADTTNLTSLADLNALNNNANAFTREGYTFTGWNTAEDGSGTEYADEAEVTITAPMTLYAQWDPEQVVAVTLNVYGGTLVTTGDGAYSALTLEPDQNTEPNTYTGTFAPGTEYALPTAAQITKTGYAFGGWYTDEQCTDGNEATAILATASEAQTFWAKWTQLNTFTHSDNFSNTKYIYRVGNSNTVTLGAIFKLETSRNVIAASAPDPNNVIITVTPDSGSNVGSNPAYTKDTSDWKQSTLKFTGTGPITITIKDGENGIPYTMDLEIVAAQNVTAYSGLSGSTNYVLLNDIEMSSNGTWALSNGTLYGNGFTFDVTAGKYGNGSNGYESTNYVIALSNAKLDNVKIIGAVYPDFGATRTDDYNFPCVLVNGGNCTIANSYISNCASPVRVRGGANLTFENTRIKGGSFCNLDIRSGAHITINGLTTVNQLDMNDGNLIGLGIVVWYEGANGSESITIVNNSLTQYNMLAQNQKSYAVSTANSAYNTMFSIDSKFIYNDGTTKWVNAGILSLESTVGSSNITTPSGYEWANVSMLSKSGHLCTSLAAAAQTGPNYESDSQYAIEPTTSFEYPTAAGKKNYHAKTQGDPDFCYWDSTQGIILIGFAEGGSKAFDPNILTVTKNGHAITPTVSVDGGAYQAVSSNITINTEGNHTLTYQYVDPYNYRYDNNRNPVGSYSVTYTKTINISVTVAIATINPATFDFNGKGYKTETANNVTYVMPNVSATTTNSIGSKSIGGKTIYYPIVFPYYSTSETGGLTQVSTSNEPYTMGNMYLWCQIFSGVVTITDYDENGNTITYGSSNTNMADGKLTNADPSGLTSILTWSSASQPNVNPQTNSGKLYYRTTNASSNARSQGIQVMQYQYVDNAGNTYRYYVGYYFPKKDKGSCLLPGTTITLANGTQKPVEQLTGSERLLVWNLETGSYDSAEIFCIDHKDLPEQEYTVDKIMFSDGTFVEIVGEQGFFDLDLAKYVYIDHNNYTQYLGHSFVKLGTGDSFDSVTLTGVETYTKVTKIYSPVTYQHFVQYANGMLTMPGEISGYFNYFEVDTDTLKYNEEKKAQDIETYGLVSYEEYGLIPEYTFNAFNTQYVKIALGKGLLDWEENLARIEHYMQFIH